MVDAVQIWNNIQTHFRKLRGNESGNQLCAAMPISWLTYCFQYTYRDCQTAICTCNWTRWAAASWRWHQNWHKFQGRMREYKKYKYGPLIDPKEFWLPSSCSLTVEQGQTRELGWGWAHASEIFFLSPSRATAPVSLASPPFFGSSVKCSDPTSSFNMVRKSGRRCSMVLKNKAITVDQNLPLLWIFFSTIIIWLISLKWGECDTENGEDK